VRYRRPLLSDSDGTREIWPAFTDVMSTMALIMFVLVLLAYVRNLISEKRLEDFRQRIAASERQLRSVQAEVRAGKAELEASQKPTARPASGGGRQQSPARQPAHPTAKHRGSACFRTGQAEAGDRGAARSHQPKQRTARHHWQQR